MHVVSRGLPHGLAWRAARHAPMSCASETEARLGGCVRPGADGARACLPPCAGGAAGAGSREGACGGSCATVAAAAAAGVASAPCDDGDDWRRACVHGGREGRERVHQETCGATQGFRLDIYIAAPLQPTSGLLDAAVPLPAPPSSASSPAAAAAPCAPLGDAGGGADGRGSGFSPSASAWADMAGAVDLVAVLLAWGCECWPRRCCGECRVRP